MEPQTPTRRTRPDTPQGTPAKTPVAQMPWQGEELTPRPASGSRSDAASPFSSPALRRLDEGGLRERLREAYGLLKEKERNLFLAATVGQELVEANQQLQDSYDQVQHKLADAELRLKGIDEDDQGSRLHGRRRSMHLQSAAERRSEPKTDDEAGGKEAVADRERQWAKTHVQPVKAQLQLAQERTDELLAEREDLGTQVYGLRQELSAALRRAADSAAVTAEAQKKAEQLEEDRARLSGDIEEQRAYWSKRWSEHQAECKARAITDEDARRIADRHAEDMEVRIRVEQRAGNLQAQLSTAQTENGQLRDQVQRMEEERMNEWEPLRARWLASEEALQELQDTHQVTCEALAQAEARLAELDKSTELNDPIKLKSEKTSTSLLGELDFQRHQAVSDQRALAREHTALKRAYGRAMNSQSRMKQQVARLTQLAATGASEARMKRLEAALGEAECQRQALLWASMEQQRHPSEMDIDRGTGSGEMDGTALVTTLRARLKQVMADRDQAQRELRTAHLLRANEIQKMRDVEREAAETEARLRRSAGELSALRAKHEALRRAAGASKKSRQVQSSDTGPPEPPGDDPCDQDLATLNELPHRKRTASGVDGGSPRQKHSPMSLAFVINKDAEPSPSALPNRSKRRRTDDASENGDVEKTKAGSANSLSEFSDAADRGLKSWLGTLGAVHAPTAAAATDNAAGSVHDAAPFVSDSTATARNPAASRSSSSSSSDQAPTAPDSGDRVKTRQSQKSASVDEIHIGSGVAQKPIECSNQ